MILPFNEININQFNFFRRNNEEYSLILILFEFENIRVMFMHDFDKIGEFEQIF